MSVFDSNSLNSGGFLHANQEKNFILVEYSEIRKSLSGAGAVMFINYGSIVSIYNSNFIDSTADFDGGTLVLNHNVSCYIKNVMIHNSNSKEIAGIISIFEYNHLKIFGSEFFSASSNIAGGFNIKYGNKIVIESCLFKKIFANDTAGLFKLLSENIIILKNLHIEDVNSDGKGGAFFLQKSNHFSLNFITIENSNSLSDFLFADQNNEIIFKNVSTINSDNIPNFYIVKKLLYKS